MKPGLRAGLPVGKVRMRLRVRDWSGLTCRLGRSDGKGTLLVLDGRASWDEGVGGLSKAGGTSRRNCRRNEEKEKEERRE